MTKKSTLSPDKKAKMRADVLSELSQAGVGASAKKIITAKPASRKTAARTNSWSPAKNPTSAGGQIKATPKSQAQPTVAGRSKPATAKAAFGSGASVSKGLSLVAKDSRPAVVKAVVPEIKHRSFRLSLSAKKMEVQSERPIGEYRSFRLQPSGKRDNISGQRDYFWLLISSLLALLLLLWAGNIYAAYQFGWRNQVVSYSAKILPLPAGRVNGQAIRLSDFLADAALLKGALSQQREGLDWSVGYVASGNNNQEIFIRLAAITLMEKALKNYGLSVSQATLDQELQKIVSQFSDEQQAAKTINELYGLSAEQFKNKVLKFVLERDLLQTAIAQDGSLAINQAAQAKAEEVLQLARDGRIDFATLAGQYTQDETGINTGGDLGWINQGELSEDLDSVLFSLNPGEVYSQPVANRFGYHIIKVDDKLADPDSGQISVKARHILIKVDVDEYLKSLLNQAKIEKYVN